MDPDPGGPKTCGSGGSGSGTLRYSNDDITGLFIFSSMSFVLFLMSSNFFFLLQAHLQIAGAAAASPCRSRMRTPAIRTVRMTTDWVRCRPTGRRRSRTRESHTSSITTQVGTSFVERFLFLGCASSGLGIIKWIRIRIFRRKIGELCNLE
jgi:hypothetical protein